MDDESKAASTSPAVTSSPTDTLTAVTSAAAFEVTFVLLTPSAFPVTEMYCDKSLTSAFCTSTNAVLSAILSAMFPQALAASATKTIITISTINKTFDFLLLKNPFFMLFSFSFFLNMQYNACFVHILNSSTMIFHEKSFKKILS